MAWLFFILLNGVLFIRPADLFQSAELPVYNLLMLLCLATSGMRLAHLGPSLGRSPITVCVLGVVAACILSHVSHANLGRAARDSIEIVKAVIYYLLLISLVDTPARLRSFLSWLVAFTLLLTALAMLHYHGVIQIESLEAVQQSDINPETGEAYVIPRLCSTGIFNDPNDLSMILVLVIIACLGLYDSAPRGLGRSAWLVPLVVFLYALRLTFSRGGLINLAVSLLILCWARLGGKKALGLAALALPVMIVLFGGRMTRVDIESTGDTSQQRIQLWAEGFALFREAPLFGVGMNDYADRVGLVAHNSFVHTYAELGFFGGMMFAGAFYAAISAVRRLGGAGIAFSDRVTMQLRPYVLAMVCSFCAGMLSLSRPYTITTYMLLGIAAAYLGIADGRASIAGLRFDGRFVERLLLVGAACVIFLYVFVRVMVRWS